MEKRWLYFVVILALVFWIVWLQAEIADRDTVIHWLRIDLWWMRKRVVGI